MLISARKKLLKFRFMLFWRSIVVGVLSLYLILYFFSWFFYPPLLGMCLEKTPFSFLKWLWVPIFFTNLAFIEPASKYANDMFLVKFADQLLEEREELKLLIHRAKDAIRYLKNFDETIRYLWDLYELQSGLDYIGVDSDEVSILIYEYDKLKNTQLDLFDIEE